jgi:acyl-CoA reductase-like NAD-dependent aldehyde dehydrogenase
MKEIFGPLVGVASTVDDEEVLGRFYLILKAIKLINDSQYGLTASIFSKDIERVNKIASKLKVGTVYGNCWGNMDPTLPWSGRKNSGKGVTLSELGFHQVTFTKSFKIKTN